MSQTFIYGLSPLNGISALQTTQHLYDNGAGNTGNMAFAFALSRQVGAGRRAVGWSGDVDAVKAAGDIGVIPAANQLGKHIDMKGLANRLAALDKTRIAVVGLGAQSDMEGAMPELPAGTLEFLAQLDRLAGSDGPNIAVRGPFSKQVLEHYGFGHRAEVMGCPSLFINPSPNLGRMIARNIRRPQRIAVAAGSFTRPEFMDLERALVRLVTESKGSYVGQHPYAMVQLTRGEADQLDPKTLRKARDYLFPNMAPNAFLRWTRAHGNVFFDIPSWMEHYRHFDLVLGMRIHGIMVALQAGIPGVCLVHDSRTLELCETMHVPHVDARSLGADLAMADLADLVKFDAEAFDANRQMLAGRYVAFLRRNGITPAPYLDAIAAAGRSKG